MKYTYTDGSGNKYELEGTEMKYVPMTPELSSSGTYSGGDPYTINLSKIELLKLIDAYEQAIWSEDDHTFKRTMGSGTLSKKIGEEIKVVMIRRNSDSMIKINKVFETLA